MLSLIYNILQTELLNIKHLLGWSLVTASITGVAETILEFNDVINSLTTVVIGIGSMIFLILRIYYTIKNKGK
jgi:hypothetical protein